MASATGIPDLNAARTTGEDEPLLGRRGDAAQVEGETIWKNLWLGTYTNSFPLCLFRR